MERIWKVLLVTLIINFTLLGTSHAAVITFSDLIWGQTSYSFDGDGDGKSDAVFSTTDPDGFNTVGPGPNMSYIQEPGLEGTALLNPDLRVDFIHKATNSLAFGFALNSGEENANTWLSFKVFDTGGNLIASAFKYGLYSLPNGMDPSDYPEGRVDVKFSGTADYALFDFNSDYGRYLIDNFQGTYGSTEVPHTVPEPSTLFLIGAGLLGVWSLRKKFTH